MRLTLSPRERQVLEHFNRGLTLEEVSAALELSPYTVKNHLARAAVKLDTKGRGRLSTVAKARKLKLIRKD